MGAIAKYCDEYVCLSSRIYLEPHAQSLPNFCACCLCAWLGHPPACWW